MKTEKEQFTLIPTEEQPVLPSRRVQLSPNIVITYAPTFDDALQQVAAALQKGDVSTRVTRIPVGQAPTFKKSI